MNCPKCNGLMILERFHDFYLGFYALKCLNCGAIIDQTIAKNRLNCRVGIQFSADNFLHDEKQKANASKSARRAA